MQTYTIRPIRKCTLFVWFVVRFEVERAAGKRNSLPAVLRKGLYSIYGLGDGV